MGLAHLRRLLRDEGALQILQGVSVARELEGVYTLPLPWHLLVTAASPSFPLSH